MRKYGLYIRLAAIALLAIFIGGAVWQALTAKYVERNGERRVIVGSDLPALATGETTIIYRSTLIRELKRSGYISLATLPPESQVQCEVFADGAVVPLTAVNADNKAEWQFQLPAGVQQLVFRFVKSGAGADARLLRISCRDDSVAGTARLTFAIIALVALIFLRTIPRLYRSLSTLFADERPVPAITPAPAPQVPAYAVNEFSPRQNKYCVAVFVINEGERLRRQLAKMKNCGADIVVADGGSTDGSTAPELLTELGVNTLLVKTGAGKLGAQMRMAFDWALKRNYEGVIVVDGNDKDSVENIADFIAALDDGADFVQGSRFLAGGHHENTPLSRLWGVKLLHAPLISLAARHRYTDTTNGFRAYSAKFLRAEKVALFRDIFTGYELHYYLAIKAARLGFQTREIPVSRVYPAAGKIPTKISPLKGNLVVLGKLFKAALGGYNAAQWRTPLAALFCLLVGTAFFAAFAGNFFHTADRRFDNFQNDSEAAVVHSIVASKNDGPGWFVINDKNIWSGGSAYEDNMLPLANYLTPLAIDNADFARGVAKATSAVVIRDNMINREFNRVGATATFKDGQAREITQTQIFDNGALLVQFAGEPLPAVNGYPHMYRTDAPVWFYHNFTALLLALTLAGLTWFVIAEFGYSAAIVAASGLMLSRWLVMMGRNLYWQPWLFFLPLLLMCAYVATGKRAYAWAVFVALTLKFANGYEFMTSVALAAVTPIVYLTLKNGAPWRSLAKRLLIWAAITLGAFAASLLVYSAVGKPWSALFARAVTRTVGGIGGDATVAPSAWRNLWNYAVYDLPFTWLPLPICGVLIIAIAASCLLLRSANRQQKALGITTLFSLLAPVSWFVLARNHSHVHRHINYALWTLPFMPLAFMATFTVIKKLLRHAHKRRKRNPYVF